MAQKTTPNNPNPADQRPFVFGKTNYRLLLLSMAIVALGFIVMSGDTDIYSTSKIVIAPILVLTGFALGFIAILKRPEQRN